MYFVFFLFWYHLEYKVKTANMTVFIKYFSCSVTSIETLYLTYYNMNIKPRIWQFSSISEAMCFVRHFCKTFLTLYYKRCYVSCNKTGKRLIHKSSGKFYCWSSYNSYDNVFSIVTNSYHKMRHSKSATVIGVKILTYIL